MRASARREPRDFRCWVRVPGPRVQDFLGRAPASLPAEPDWPLGVEEDSAAWSVDSVHSYSVAPKPHSAVRLSLRAPRQPAWTIHIPPTPAASALPLAGIAYTIGLEDSEIDPTAKCPRLSRSPRKRNQAPYTMNASHRTGNSCFKVLRTRGDTAGDISSQVIVRIAR